MKEDTGLNIVAISIFTMTMMVLIGPVFNISPFVPATITFVALSLVTVDTLAWQNKGTNLFVNLFASEEEKERIIYHEAGHFLLASAYEIPIMGYTLTPWEALKARFQNSASGGVIFDTSILGDKPKNLKDITLTIEHFGIVLMAGVAAEKVIYEDSQGGEEDRQVFRSIYSDVGLNLTQFNTKQRSAVLQAKTIIEGNKESYLALVEAMKQRLPVNECQATLGQLSLDCSVNS